MILIPSFHPDEGKRDVVANGLVKPVMLFAAFLIWRWRRTIVEEIPEALENLANSGVTQKYDVRTRWNQSQNVPRK